MPKKIGKTQAELNAELDQQERKRFLEEYEAAVTPINDKYSMRLVPLIHRKDNGGTEPIFAIQRFTKEVIEVKKADENGDKPKAE